MGAVAWRVRYARGGVAILGGGFAGAYVARLLGERGATVVSPENFMLYTPMLPEAASGTLEPRHTVVPLRQMCPHVELVLGQATALDEQAREVAVESEAGPFRVRYEQLVVALGAVPRTFPIPGLAEHARGFKSLADAIALRNHVLRRLELADAAVDADRRESELGFVFVGGGYAGVEALAELQDLVDDACRFYPGLRHAPRRWVLVDVAPRILAEIPERLGRYAGEELRGRGVDIRTGTGVARIEADSVTLEDGTHIPARTVVWTAGVQANPVLRRLGLPLDEQRRVRVDGQLRVEGRSRTWALGDCARVPNPAMPAGVDPPTSQHALRQARTLAHNLRATLEGGPLRTYRYRMLGQVATLGHFKGIADVLGLKLSGFPGWFVTRGYHLYQLPLASRKLRVVVDWTVGLAFPRDIAELGTIGHPARLGDGEEPGGAGPG